MRTVRIPIYGLTPFSDGWNLVAEVNILNSAIRTYMWGLDLSGSLQGAGGVGGLLAVTDQATINSQPSTHCVSYDGNGNVAALVNAGDGLVSAQYEYGPFGEVIRATGPTARVNPFRFSTKYQDDETDLLYYGYRYYSASIGRWLSRDPLGDEAFVGTHFADSSESKFKDLEHLRLMPPYQFVHNNPICGFDVLGLYNNCCCEDWLVGENANVLLYRYQSAHAYLDPRAPKRPFNPLSSWSCFNLAKNILQYMAPIPPCWTCHVENRRKYRLRGYLGWSDENSIVCTSHPKSGSSRTLVFDYYQDWTAVPYSTFTSNYPTPWYTGDDARFDDCVHTDRHNAMDTKWLDNIINPGHGVD